MITADVRKVAALEARNLARDDRFQACVVWGAKLKAK